MATVQYWDAVWFQDIQGGSSIDLVVTGFNAATAVHVTGYPVGPGGPLSEIENMRVAWNPGPAMFFDLANVGPPGSVAEATNLAFSFISQ